MYITLHLSDGEKITKEHDRLKFIADPDGLMDGFQLIEEGCITVNWDHVVYMHPAEDEEIKHSKIHGW